MCNGAMTQSFRTERAQRARRTYASAHETICNDECVTMNVYRAECVTELGSNNSEPERAKRARAHICERTRALNSQKHVAIASTKP